MEFNFSFDGSPVIVCCVGSETRRFIEEFQINNIRLCLSLTTHSPTLSLLFFLDMRLLFAILFVFYPCLWLSRNWNIRKPSSSSWKKRRSAKKSSTHSIRKSKNKNTFDIVRISCAIISNPNIHCRRVSSTLGMPFLGRYDINADK